MTRSRAERKAFLAAGDFFARVRALMAESGAATIEEVLSEDEFNALRDRVAAEQQVPVDELDSAIKATATPIARRKKMN